MGIIGVPLLEDHFKDVTNKTVQCAYKDSLLGVCFHYYKRQNFFVVMKEVLASFIKARYKTKAWRKQTLWYRDPIKTLTQAASR